jgi:ribose/xylose/arabinose/galactoside ABC-type transport system permease subunit
MMLTSTAIRYFTLHWEGNNINMKNNSIGKLSSSSFLRSQKVNEESLQLIVTCGILLLLMAIITTITPRFLTVTNINNVLIQVSLVMITGSAVTLLLISGNIDLSVGGVVGQAAVLYAFLTRAGIPTLYAIIVATMSGAIIGIINGLLVVKVKITPVIATLGTMYAARGIAHIFANGSMISTGLPRNFKAISTTYIGPVSLTLVFVMVIVGIFYFIQKKTNLGQYVFYIGSNQRTAHFSGVRVGKIVTTLYVLTGTLAAFSGVLLAARLGAGDAKMGEGFEFDTIIAAVIGGTSIAGGKGTVIGMVIGALILGVLSNSLNLLSVQSYYQLVVKGVILIVAIVLQRVLVEKAGR